MMQIHSVFQQISRRLFYHCHGPRLTFGLIVLSPPVRLQQKSSDFYTIVGTASLLVGLRRSLANLTAGIRQRARGSGR